MRAALSDFLVKIYNTFSRILALHKNRDAHKHTRATMKEKANFMVV